MKTRIDFFPAIDKEFKITNAKSETVAFLANFFRTEETEVFEKETEVHYVHYRELKLTGIN